jgi:hypothetical protein
MANSENTNGRASRNVIIRPADTASRTSVSTNWMTPRGRPSAM